MISAGLMTNKPGSIVFPNELHLSGDSLGWPLVSEHLPSLYSTYTPFVRFPTGQLSSVCAFYPPLSGSKSRCTSSPASSFPAAAAAPTHAGKHAGCCVRLMLLTGTHNTGSMTKLCLPLWIFFPFQALKTLCNI